jgi:L-lactate dehydrogenase (cytochrome)
MGHTHRVVPATALDFRRLAEKRLPRFLFDYIDGGANDELTLAANVADFQGIRIRQRVLVDVSQITTATTLAGEAAAMPLALGPVGMAGMFARRGETQAGRAADSAKVPFTLSTVGICALDEVREAASRPFWFQLYMIRDREAVQALLQRAAAEGCHTLVFTVDLPMPGMRHRDTRNGMFASGLKGKLAKVRQVGVRPGWVRDVVLSGKPLTFGNLADRVPGASDLNAYSTWINAQFDRSVTWKDIAWLRSIWKGQLILKGIQEVDDARAAVDVGADGLIVSNHGARQLDSVASSITKLPAVADAVSEQLEVYVDGGVRSGVDIFKAVALGARGVLIGRPWAWALAGGGQAGVDSLLATFKRELEVAMALAGVISVDQINRDHLDAPHWSNQ